MNKLSIIIVIGILCSYVACMAQQPHPIYNVTTPEGKDLRIHMINHGSLAISYEGMEIYIDPVTKAGDKKTDYSGFPAANVILISHEHADHYDPAAIKALKNDETQIYANKAVCAKLPGCIEMQNAEIFPMGPGIHVMTIPAYNTTPDRLKYHPKGNGYGFLINIDGYVIYVSGDTENIDEMKQLGQVNIAFLAVNQPYTMTIEQCVSATQAINPKILIPYHMGNTDISSLQEKLSDTGVEVQYYEELR